MTSTAQGERIAVALERIAAALEVLVLGAMEPPADAPEGCVHPEDARVDFGVTAGAADWACRACGFRSIAEVETHG